MLVKTLQAESLELISWSIEAQLSNLGTARKNRAMILEQESKQQQVS